MTQNNCEECKELTAQEGLMPDCKNFCGRDEMTQNDERGKLKNDIKWIGFISEKEAFAETIEIQNCLGEYIKEIHLEKLINFILERDSIHDAVWRKKMADAIVEDREKHEKEIRREYEEDMVEEAEVMIRRNERLKVAKEIKKLTCKGFAHRILKSYVVSTLDKIIKECEEK